MTTSARFKRKTSSTDFTNDLTKEIEYIWTLLVWKLWKGIENHLTTGAGGSLFALLARTAAVIYGKSLHISSVVVLRLVVDHGMPLWGMAHRIWGNIWGKRAVKAP